MTEKVFHGVPAAGGIEIGPAYLYNPQGLSASRRALKPGEVEAESARFKQAIVKTRAQIADLEAKAKQKLGEEHASIFHAHQILLDDPLFME